MRSPGGGRLPSLGTRWPGPRFDPILIVLMWSAPLVALRPLQNTPFVDDWVYAWAVEHLLSNLTVVTATLGSALTPLALGSLTREQAGTALPGGLLVAGAVYGVASWVRTKYWIDEDELRIDTGVVVRQSRRIRIDRLQGIDIVQPLVARLMGLAELKFDLASGSEREGSLAFLPLREALELRADLLERRDDLREDLRDEVPRDADGVPALLARLATA